MLALFDGTVPRLYQPPTQMKSFQSMKKQSSTSQNLMSNSKSALTVSR